MKIIKGYFVVEPDKFTEDGKRSLANRMYPLHQRIFDGVNKDTFSKYVINSKAERSAIAIHHNSAGEDVGYCAMHFFEQESDTQMTCVIRMESGLLPEYRGNNSNIGFIMQQLLRYKIKNPMHKIYYLGTLVHPSSYLLLAKYADKVWPGEHQPTKKINSIISSAISAFELEPVDPSKPNVVHVGWKTRDSKEDQYKWRESKNPSARRYLDLNPGYMNGHGLVTLAPLTTGSLCRAWLRMFRYKTKKILLN